MRFVFTITQTRGFGIGLSLMFVGAPNTEFSFTLLAFNRAIQIGFAKS